MVTSKEPTLIVTVDTEEEGLWQASYKVHDNSVANLRGVPRFQEVCEKYGVHPTYLIDTPVVEDDYGAGQLRDYQQSHVAEVGAHLHPWCAPPFEEEVSSHNSFMCNLSETLQRQKLQILTDRITERMKAEPKSFRAGRYGLDNIGARILTELGYVVDSSVIPYNSFAPEGGPDFTTADHSPYFLDGDDICQQHTSGFLLEVPVSFGFNRRNFRRAKWLRDFAAKTPLRQLRMVGILDRLGIVRRIKFSPEQATAEQMKRLADIYRKQAAPCLVMMMHSSSFVEGFSPYCKTREKLDAFYQHLDETLHYCMSTCGMATQTLTEFAHTYMGAQSAK